MSAATLRPTPRERRLARYLGARRDAGLVEALLELRGTRFGSRYECVSLYAVGGEGAVFLARDLLRAAPLRVAKIALLPFHRPFELDAATVAKRREIIEVEARYLAGTGGTFLPQHLGTYDFINPLLDPARGGVFAEPGPAIVMERLPGHDLDRWLARAHRSDLPVEVLRPTLDGVSAMLLQAVAELLDRGLLYADLRPANLRMLPQPRRHARLLDAGSLVTVYDRSGRFPHVPAYLPPEMLEARGGPEPILPSPAVQAVMTGRTLYEVATGQVPHPGEEVDEDALRASPVSPRVAELIAGLARGEFDDTRDALECLGASAPPPPAGTPSTSVAATSGPPTTSGRSTTTPVARTGVRYPPSVQDLIRRRRRAQKRASFQDGLRTLRELLRMTGGPPPEPPPAPPPSPPVPPAPAAPAAPAGAAAPAGTLIEVPRPRLLVPDRSIDQHTLRLGLTSPAVADAIGRLARGEFRNAADALRYARATPSQWQPAESDEEPREPTPAEPETERARPAPSTTPAPRATRATPTRRARAVAAALRPLPVRAAPRPSLAERVVGGLRRLLGR